MDDARFWELLEPGRLEDDPKNQLRAALVKLEPAELVSFQEHFDAAFDRAYRWDLWGAAYVINDGCTPDEFDSFRYSLILAGRSVFDAALRDPDSLAYAKRKIVPDHDAGYLALDAYDARTSSELPRVDRTTPGEPLGDRWDFGDAALAKRRLPKLFAKYRA